MGRAGLEPVPSWASSSLGRLSTDGLTLTMSLQETWSALEYTRSGAEQCGRRKGPGTGYAGTRGRARLFSPTHPHIVRAW